MYAYYIPQDTDEEVENRVSAKPSRKRSRPPALSLPFHPSIRHAFREFWAAVEQAARVADEIATEDARAKHKQMSADVAFEIFQQLTPDIDLCVPHKSGTFVIARRPPTNASGYRIPALTPEGSILSLEDEVQVLPAPIARQNSPEVEAVPSIPPLRLRWRVRTFLPGGEVWEHYHPDGDDVRSQRCLNERNAYHRSWRQTLLALLRLGFRLPADGTVESAPRRCLLGDGDSTQQSTVDSTLKRMACPICYRTLRQRSHVITRQDDETNRVCVNSCGHILCFDCLASLKRSAGHGAGGSIKCPECRQRLGKPYEVRL